MIRSFLLLLQIAVAQPARQPGISLADSVQLRAHVDSATRAFQEEWAGAWIVSQASHPLLATYEYVRDGDERAMGVHCHWDLMRMWLHRRLIRGTVPAHATCSRVLPPDVVNVEDERRRIDNGVDAKYRAGVAVDRLRLRLVLDSAAERLSGDIYLAGQRVRFALDAGDLEGAGAAGLSCGYEPIRCGVLQGLILYRLGDAAPLTPRSPRRRAA